MCHNENQSTPMQALAGEIIVRPRSGRMSRVPEYVMTVNMRMINTSGCHSSHQVDPQLRALQNCFSPLTLRQCNGGWVSSATALLPPGGEW